MNPIRSLFVALSRMPPAVMLLLIVGLAIVITMVVTNNLTEVQRRAQEREAALKALYESKSNVVYAVKDLSQGDTITADAVQEKQELASKIPPGALGNVTLAVGRVAKFPISSGQILANRDLVGIAQATGLESVLKPGFQAVTMSVDSDTGVADFITPGSHVDIYATAGSESRSKSGAILSDCSVIAVDKDYGQESAPQKKNAIENEPGRHGGYNMGGMESTRHITLQLEPKDIQLLLKGVQSTAAGGGHGGSAGGKLYLTLRGFDDKTRIPIIDIGRMFETQAAVASLPPPPRFAAPPMPRVAPMPQVEIWAGNHKDMITVPQT